MRALLERAGRTSPASAEWGLLLLRLGYGLTLAIAHGLGKITGLAAFTNKVADMGFAVPGLLGPLAALAEFAGGLLLALGLLTRPAALVVTVNMLVAAFVVHSGDPFGDKELALAYAAAAGVLLVTGPGRLSLDARLWARPSSS